MLVGLAAILVAPVGFSASQSAPEGVVDIAAQQVGPQLKWIEPKYYSQMSDSHGAFVATADARAKMMRDDHTRFAEMPETLPVPENVWVWTLGEEVSILKPGNLKFPAGVIIEGRRATTEERTQIAAVAPIDWTSEARPFASVVVTTKDQIRELLALPFVYLVEVQVAPVGAAGAKLGESEGGADWHAYQADWIRTKQKVDQAKASRDGVDGGGNGAMPNSVWFHIIDTGYDSAETKFSSAYAASQVNSHGHDWTTNNNGIAGPENNEHGTLVADILDLMNYGGGTFYVHQVSSWDDIRQAYEDIDLNHVGADVVSSSYVLLYTDSTCHDDYDDILSNLVQLDNTVISVAVGNHDQNVYIAYPASSTFVFGVGGATNSIGDWDTPSGAQYGSVTLDRSQCLLQYDWHDARDDARSIFKPDVYGFYHITTDNDGTWYGTSFAQPEIASGLGTIESRYYLGTSGSFIKWKVWDSGNACWEGAYKLVKASASPSGQDVDPAASSQLGNLADHNAWFLDGTTC